MKICISTLLAFLFSLSSAIQAQKVSAVLDTNEISIGEQTKLHLEIEFSAADDVAFPDLRDSLNEFIQIVEKSKIDTSYAENDVTTKILSQNLTITSFDSGYHPIRPILFSVNGDTLGTEPMLLTVKMVIVPQNADIKDIKDILDVPFTFWDWVKMNKWTIISALVLIILILLGIYTYRKYKNSPKVEIEMPQPLIPAHEIALSKLEELKSKKLWQNSKVKEYHVELSYIIREYLENRYDTNSLDNTTDEILYESRSLDMSEEDRNRLTQVLVLADMAKFAKQEPISHENEQSMKNAEAFVVSTKKIIEEVNAENVTKTEKEE